MLGAALALLPVGVYLAPGVAPSEGDDYKQQQKRRMAKDLGLRPLVVVLVAEAAVQSARLPPVQPSSIRSGAPGFFLPAAAQFVGLLTSS